MAQRQYDVIVNMFTSRYQKPLAGAKLSSDIPDALTRIAIGLRTVYVAWALAAAHQYHASPCKPRW